MKMGYRASLQWIVDNDDTCWLDEEHVIPSTTAVFLADIFDQEIEKVTADLRRLKQKRS